MTHRTIAVAVVAMAAVYAIHLVIDGLNRAATLRPPVTTIDVSGTAIRRMNPDQVHWAATIVAPSAECTVANRELKQQVARAMAFLAAHEVTDAELSLQPASCDRQTRQVGDPDHPKTVDDGVMAVQRLVVVSHDVRRSQRAFRAAAAELVDAGVEQPWCTVTSLPEVQQQLVDEARKKVRTEAETSIGALGGARLGRLVTANLTDAPPQPVQGSCEQVVLTATAKATYELD